MAGKLGNLFVALGLDKKAWHKGLASVGIDARKSSQQIQRTFGNISFKNLLIGSFGIYGLKRGFESLMKPAIDLEKELAQVSTMLDDQSMRLMPRYKREIEAMALAYGEATSTLSKGAYDILSASIAPTQAMKVLGISAKAAAAGITDTGVAADAITTILNSYGMSASQAGKVSDILFGIVKRGKTTFAELAPQIGQVASLASQVDLSLEEMGASLATMTRKGIRTDAAVTSLNNILTAFLKPSKEGAKAAKALGFELNSATIKSIGLTGVMEKLKNASAEQLAQLFPNIRGLKGFIAALADAKGYASDYQFMLNSLGSTQEAYTKVADTAATSLNRWNQMVTVLKGLISEGFLTSMKSFINYFVTGMTAIRAVDPGVLQLQEDITKVEKMIETRRRLPGGGAGIRGTSIQQLQLELESKRRLFRLLTKEITPPEPGKVTPPPGPPPPGDLGYSTKIAARESVKSYIKSLDVLQAESRKKWREMKKDTSSAFIMPITEEIEAMAEVPLTVIDNWRDAWNFGIDDMISRAADLRTQFEWTGSDIVMGWSNTMSGLMQGTMKFRDFSRQMFMDVASSFMNMTARLAAQKLFDATVGKLQFSSGGGGSGFSYDAVKYRGAGRKVWAG